MKVSRMLEYNVETTDVNMDDIRVIIRNKNGKVKRNIKPDTKIKHGDYLICTDSVLKYNQDEDAYTTVFSMFGICRIFVNPTPDGRLVLVMTVRDGNKTVFYIQSGELQDVEIFEEKIDIDDIDNIHIGTRCKPGDEDWDVFPDYKYDELMVILKEGSLTRSFRFNHKKNTIKIKDTEVFNHGISVKWTSGMKEVKNKK